MTASQITLDTKKLLGFKIVAATDSTATLHSPKIGVKGCSVRNVTDANAAKPAGKF